VHKIPGKVKHIKKAFKKRATEQRGKPPDPWLSGNK